MVDGWGTGMKKGGGGVKREDRGGEGGKVTGSGGLGPSQMNGLRYYFLCFFIFFLFFYSMGKID